MSQKVKTSKVNIDFRLIKHRLREIKVFIGSCFETDWSFLFHFLNIFEQFLLTFWLKTLSFPDIVKLISSIKVLTQNLHDRDGPSILSQIYEIFQDDYDDSQVERTTYFSFIEFLTVIIYIYCIIGEDCFYGIEEENRIKVWPSSFAITNLI